MAHTAGPVTPVPGSPQTDPPPQRPFPRWAVIGIFAMLAVAGLAYAQTFLTPVILAFVLALVFSPLRRALERVRIAPGLAAALIVTTLLALLIVAVTALATPVRQWTADAPQIGAKLEERVRDIRASFGADEEGTSLGEVVEKVTEAAAPGEDDAEAPVEVVVQEESWLTTIASSGSAILIQFILTLVLLFFILASGDMFYEKMVHVTPRFADKRKAIRIAREIERKLSRYLLTITVINFGLGTAVGLAFWALGMPDPLLFGVLAALMNYVPYVGAVVGAAVALVVGLLTFDGLWGGVAPALVYYALTSIEGQFVTPYAVGRNLKLNTVVVFIAVAFWAWLWSIVGMLLAVPLLVAVRVLCEHVDALEPLGDFLSARGAEREKDDDEEEPPAPQGRVAA